MILMAASCRPLHGLAIRSNSDPGACAPGFMLPPASQAQTALFVQGRSGGLCLKSSKSFLDLVRER